MIVTTHSRFFSIRLKDMPVLRVVTTVLPEAPDSFRNPDPWGLVTGKAQSVLCSSLTAQPPQPTRCLWECPPDRGHCPAVFPGLLGYSRQQTPSFQVWGV